MADRCKGIKIDGEKGGRGEQDWKLTEGGGGSNKKLKTEKKLGKEIWRGGRKTRVLLREGQW